jgi:hypothetical protein
VISQVLTLIKAAILFSLKKAAILFMYI